MSEPELKETKSIWQLLREAHRRIHVTGAVSLYLLLAIIVVLLLGAGALGADPTLKRTVLVVSLLLVFFFVVFARALADLVEIATHHFREREKVFQATLGDEEFVTELGRRVRANESDE